MSNASQPTPARKPIICSRSHQVNAICLSLVTIALNPLTLALGVVAIAMAPTPERCAEAAATAPRFVLEWGSQGSDPGQFDFPIGIAINRADEVFVTEFTNARVQSFSRP